MFDPRVQPEPVVVLGEKVAVGVVQPQHGVDAVLPCVGADGEHGRFAEREPQVVRPCDGHRFSSGRLNPRKQANKQDC